MRLIPIVRSQPSERVVAGRCRVRRCPALSTSASSPPKLATRALGQRRRVLRFGDVAGNDDGVVEIDRDLVERRAPPPREDDAVAVGGEPPRARRADAASRSRDDDGLHPRQPTRYSRSVPPHLDAIGIVTADMAASCRFYALLGVPVGEPAEGEDHFEATLPSGIRLMWDSVELMQADRPGLAAARRVIRSGSPSTAARRRESTRHTPRSSPPASHRRASPGTRSGASATPGWSTPTATPSTCSRRSTADRKRHATPREAARRSGSRRPSRARSRAAQARRHRRRRPRPSARYRAARSARRRRRSRSRSPSSRPARPGSPRSSRRRPCQSSCARR